MPSLIYVSNVGETGNLSAIEDLFLTVGDVKAQYLEMIPESGHRLSFGVFEMSTDQQAADCVERFNGYNMNGQRLGLVSERPKARPVVERPKKRASKK
jgi:hypothetical protein